MFLEKENLSEIDQYNEYIMTGLRTIWGVSVHYLEEKFGSNYSRHSKYKSQKFIQSNHLT